MDKNKSKWSGLHWAAWFLILPMLYVLSYGPVCAYCRKHYGYGFNAMPHPIRLFYYPLANYSYLFAGHLLEDYVQMWIKSD